MLGPECKECHNKEKCEKVLENFTPKQELKKEPKDQYVVVINTIGLASAFIGPRKTIMCDSLEEAVECITEYGSSAEPMLFKRVKMQVETKIELEL